MISEPAIQSATLLISCPDRQGLVAAITHFIAHNGGNILHLDQHVDAQENVFFMRVEWDMSKFQIVRAEIAVQFATVAAPFNMSWELFFSDDVLRMAVFVSKEAHCLYDILYRHQSGEWRVDIPVIVSNHPDMSALAEKFGIPFRLTPVTKDNKAEAEQAQLQILSEYKIDLVVLARYMQIISENFVNHYPNRIINIHHSFLRHLRGRNRITGHMDAALRSLVQAAIM